MEEEKLVIFDTAILAKEKGFNFTHRKYLIDVFDLEDKNPVSMKTVDYYTNTNLCALAPTQSFLQKWLREVHGIHVQPKKTFHNTTYIIGKILVETRLPQPEFKEIYNQTSSYNGPHKEKYKTYEEALEIGLQKGLNLIKNLHI